MRTLFTAAALTVLSCTSVAHADYFTVQGTFQSGGTLSGYVDVQLTPGQESIAIADLTATLPTGVFESSLISEEVTLAGTPPLLLVSVTDYIPAPTFTDVLSFVTPTSDNAEFPICTLSEPCQGTVSFFTSSADTYDPIVSGELIPEGLTVTPEPSSFVLAFTGVLGAAGGLRRLIRRER